MNRLPSPPANAGVLPMILLCPACLPHEFQDAKYGVKMRVHTPCKAKIGGAWRCTVCGDEKTIARPPRKEATK